jgi:TatD DNase family protein
VIDTHCHVHDRKFDDDRDAVIARARAAGITEMVTIAEDLADSRVAVATAQRYGIRSAIGVHPHEAKNAPDDLAAHLRAMLDEPSVVAIGETGLDYYYGHSPREAQAQVLRTQLCVARETGMPVVFHQRDAFDDFTSILREEWTSGMRGIVHCFTGTAAEAATITGEFGLLLGIGGVVTFPNAGALREAVTAAGAERIVLETDCPYLAPVPMRGKRNEPAFVAHTAEKVRELLGMPLDALIAVTDENARRLFSL